MNIIEDLQTDLLKSDCDVASALRKARVISYNLGLVEFEEWVKHELSGYNKNDILPSYRRNIYGQLKCLHKRGLLPLSFSDSQMENTASCHDFIESIPELIALLNNIEGPCISSKYPASLSNIIWKDSGYPPMDIYIIIEKSAINNINEQVKNKLLDWVLMLNNKGITAEETSFSSVEKTKALNDPQIVNYVTNIYGNVEGSQIQQGTSNSNQIIL